MSPQKTHTVLCTRTNEKIIGSGSKAHTFFCVSVFLLFALLLFFFFFTSLSWASSCVCHTTTSSFSIFYCSRVVFRRVVVVVVSLFHNSVDIGVCVCVYVCVFRCSISMILQCDRMCVCDVCQCVEWRAYSNTL